MKRTLFILLYLVSLCVLPAAYLAPSGIPLDAYGLSMALGAFATGAIGWQFILASRPKFVVDALGAKGALSLHMAMPALLVALAYAHHLLKTVALGMAKNAPQPLLGTAALGLFAAVVVFSLLMFGNTPLSRRGPVKAFRAKALPALGLDYKRMRALHNVTVLAALAAGTHAALASSASFATAGVACALGWMAFAVGFHLARKLRAARAGAGKPAASA